MKKIILLLFIFFDVYALQLINGLSVYNLSDAPLGCATCSFPADRFYRVTGNNNCRCGLKYSYKTAYLDSAVYDRQCLIDQQGDKWGHVTHVDYSGSSYGEDLYYPPADLDY
jgi:nitrous oxidase accessory protein NosD